jgi:chromosome segregation protein
MAETDRVARATLDALSASREACARSEERMEGTRRRLDDIEREIRDMLEVEPHGVAALAEIAPESELPAVTDIEADLEKLRRDRERRRGQPARRGRTREVETRHTGLTTERDDLVEAIKKLRTGIQSLNKEARERLLTSFETVNAHFKRLFTELFGGGQAELTLIESDDPLEAGLEIIAKPPGKKPQTLAALGRRAGADGAGADLRGVPHQPVTDLRAGRSRRTAGRHNVERFCNLLHEMTSSTETRFIIITHNRSPWRMNRLFGVTMAERGVSQLVSVDLDGAMKVLDQNVA